jgi:hypothetical protein
MTAVGAKRTTGVDSCAAIGVAVGEKWSIHVRSFSSHQCPSVSHGSTMSSPTRSTTRPVWSRHRQRKRCDARVKNVIKTRKNGVAVVRGLHCRAWAMPNGRCRVHGGASTGPKSPEGKARVVAAMVEGRRKWVARRRAEGGRFTAGRKTGSAWVTEPMQERARAEAHRLGGGRFTLDQPLVLALLRSAKGDDAWETKAKAMLDAHEQAEADRERGQALSVVRDLRARAIAAWSGRAPVPTTFPFAEVGPNTYAPAPYAPIGSGDDPATPAAKLRRNLFLALDVLEKIMMGSAPDYNLRDKRLAVEAATMTIKVAISADKNMLKAPPRAPWSINWKFNS